MPRKKSIIPPATRIRDNQRRSRARRTQLIEQLQHRLREYEAKEHQATLAMQLAARRVAWENTQLKDLLERNGVSSEKIKDFLSQQECMNISNIPTRELPNHNPRYPTRVHQDRTLPRDRPLEDLSVSSPVNPILCQRWNPKIATNEQEDVTRTNSRDEQNDVIDPRISGSNEEVPTIDVPAHELINMGFLKAPSIQERYECDVDDPLYPIDMESIDIESINIGSSNASPTIPRISDCDSQVPLPSDSSIGDDLMLQMSCETAAQIISSMRGHGSHEQARLQLGCRDSDHCNIQNIKVLQVMEMD